MALGLVAIAVILVYVLGHTAQRRSGTDLTPNGAFVATLAAGQQTCQGQELLPADTSALRATIGTYGKPGPALRVRMTGPRGEPLSTGALRPGWREGIVQIEITHVARAHEQVQLCLRNLGPGAIAIAGALPDPGWVMKVAGHPVEGRLRYDYMRPGNESWFQLLPTIVYRSTLAKGGIVRHWAWAAALVAMLLALALAFRLVARGDAA
jgi:hypothetical protein